MAETLHFVPLMAESGKKMTKSHKNDLAGEMELSQGVIH